MTNTFKIKTDECGETWFYADKPIHHNTMKKFWRDNNITPKYVDWKDGVFSTYDKFVEETR